MGSGGTLYKGKVLASFVSMVIHGLLIAKLIYDFFVWKMFEKCGEFGKYLKREFNFVMILVRMYTKCYLVCFERCF